MTDIADKFLYRVWDKENNRYIQNCHITYNDGTYTQVSTRAIPGGMYQSYIVGEYNTFDVIIEQCTGLKDFNGKLIYEGDILRPKSNSIKKVVVYEDGSYWAQDVIYYHDKCHIFQRWINECEYEIVGNINENKELLNEDK